jgi:hypothetical protein
MASAATSRAAASRRALASERPGASLPPAGIVKVNLVPAIATGGVESVWANRGGEFSQQVAESGSHGATGSGLGIASHPQVTDPTVPLRVDVAVNPTFTDTVCVHLALVGVFTDVVRVDTYARVRGDNCAKTQPVAVPESYGRKPTGQPALTSRGMDKGTFAYSHLCLPHPS